MYGTQRFKAREVGVEDKARQTAFAMPTRDGLSASLGGEGTIVLYQQDHSDGEEAYIWLDCDQARTLIDWLYVLIDAIDATAGE